MINLLQENCLAEMSKNGVSFSGPVVSDGKIYRFSADQKRNKKDEWYVAYEGHSPDGNPYLICVYGSWSTSQSIDGKYTYISWNEDAEFDESEREYLHREVKRKKEAAAKELQNLKDLAAYKANEIWKDHEHTQPTEAHLRYCVLKKIEPIGIRFGVNPQGYPALIIPIQNINKEIRSLQFISVADDGTVYKTLLTDGEKSGNFFVFGHLKNGDPISIGEGYSTCFSIFEGSNKARAVVVAFDCHNLDKVVEGLAEAYPNSPITLCGDDDVETEGNPGRTKAEALAKKYTCKIIFPTFATDFELPNGKKLTDFNDLHVNFGIEEVKKQISPKKSYLKTINIHELLNTPIPPRELILAPWLPENGLAMIYAPRGIGKTFLALTVAHAIACGQSVLGWEIPRPRKVLYVDGEMPAVAIKERLSYITKLFSKPPPDPSYFNMIFHEFQSEGIHDLSSARGQEELNESIKDADVIILDNLSTLVRSGNENEAESWLPIQEWALSMRKQRKTVIFIHHAGKSGMQRGTSKREDVLDTVISLKKPKGQSPSDGAKFEVHFEKARGFYGKDADSFEATLSKNGDDSLKWSRKGIEGQDLEEIIRLHKEGLTQREIAEAVGVSVGKVNKLLKQAGEKG